MYGAFTSDDEEEPVYVPDAEDKVEDGRRLCYYNAYVPWEIEDERFEFAIEQAREAFPDYVIPCYWELVSDVGENVRVRRVSRA